MLLPFYGTKSKPSKEHVGPRKTVKDIPILVLGLSQAGKQTGK
jgi:hypothetical protein